MWLLRKGSDKPDVDEKGLSQTNGIGRVAPAMWWLGRLVAPAMWWVGGLLFRK